MTLDRKLKYLAWFGWQVVKEFEIAHDKDDQLTFLSFDELETMSLSDIQAFVGGVGYEYSN